MSDKGDKTSRVAPSTGASLPKGLTYQAKITESPESLGMGSKESNGLPNGPQKGKLGSQRIG